MCRFLTNAKRKLFLPILVLTTYPTAASVAVEDTHQTSAAIVNGVPVSVAEVNFELSRALGPQQPEQEAVRYLKARTLQQLIDRELVLQWLGTKSAAANDAEVALAVSRLEKRLAARETTLERHLEERDLSRVELERALRWQLSWPRFVKRYLTDVNLENYYRDHRADFDGTTIRVAHLLLPVEQDLTEAARAAQLAEQRKLASQLRGQILAGDISFATATRKHSSAPTARDGGDIGFIERHDPMPSAFSDATYQLAEGEISEPVESRFGIHLIQCLEIKPGQGTWQSVRPELQVAIKQYLFEWALGQARAGAEIQFTGNSPHFQAGTSVLAD